MVAQAKLAVAWPEGKELSRGACTSGFGVA
jgi:hypothetical protein